MLAITFSIRYSLFAFPDLRFPPTVRRGLHYVPTAVLTAIVVPGMLLPDGQHWSLGPDNTYLLAGLATIAIAALSCRLSAADCWCSSCCAWHWASCRSEGGLAGRV